MIPINDFQKAICLENLDGWLFTNFRHRDTLTNQLLNLESTSVSSRRWFYIIPSHGEPIKIVHAIELLILEKLPGITFKYASQEELERHLQKFSAKRIAVLSDPTIQILSTLDASTWNLLERLGVHLHTAASLIQRIKGVLTEDLLISHQKAGLILKEAINEAWSHIQECFLHQKDVYEKEVQDILLAKLAKEGLITDHPPIVAFGSASADPHYSPPRETLGNKAQKNQVVQFDIWAKYPDGAYADISWLGFTASEIPTEVQKNFEHVIYARDLVYTKICESFAEGISVTGSMLDTVVRTYLLQHVPTTAIQHRTGHGIDTDCHGSGVNLDSIEFSDNRFLIEGSCFSVEPGIYLEQYGLRSEINISIKNNTAIVTGPTPQYTFLSL